MNWKKKLIKDGYPEHIIGNGGYPATLVGLQQLIDGDYAAIYRYPGGDCVQFLEDIEIFTRKANDRREK